MTLQTAKGLEPCPFDYATPVRILARGQYLYKFASFSHVPASKRDAALAVQLGIWSPFERTGHHLVWHGAEVQVWMWDREAVVRALPLADKEAVYPETVWHPRMEDGLYLTEVADGFDLQYLSGGLLRQSHWFAERPKAEEIDMYCRLNKLDGLIPTVQPLTWLAEPWRSPVTLEDLSLVLEPGLLTTAVALILSVGLWQETRIQRAAVATDRMEGRIESLQERLDESALMKSDFSRLRQRNGALRAALEQPPQAEMMVRLDRYVPSSSAGFELWSYLQGNIRLAVNDPVSDQAEYVRRIEEDGAFSGSPG